MNPRRPARGRRAWRESAAAAVQGRFPAHARKRGKAKAVVATGNTQMKVFHALLSNPGTRYQDPGPDYYERLRDHNRHVSRLIGELGNLGYDVTLCRKPQPEDAPAA